MAKLGKLKKHNLQLNHTSKPKKFKQLCRKFRNRICIVSEGDSWFAYPKKNIIAGKNSNIINNLIRVLKNHKRKFNMLELANNGDEIVDMLSGDSKFVLLNVVKDIKVDFLLISGGGNDFVGKFDFEFVLRKNPEGTKPVDYINKVRFDRKLIQIKHAYQDLIDYMDTFSKNKDIKIITHTYGHVTPQNKPAKFLKGIIEKGPWMFPALKKCQVPKEHWKPIATMLIDRMKKNIKLLHESSNGRFHFVDSTELITDNDWIDEIHLTPNGFKRVAKAMHDKMMELV